MRWKRANRLDINCLLLFLLGLFSTFQIIEVMGMTVFIWLLFIVVLKIVIGGKIRIGNRLIIFFMLCTLISEIMSFSIKVSNAMDWRIASWKIFAIYIALFILFGYLKTEKMLFVFFKGLYYSCMIQIIWCYLQYIFWHIGRIQLNDLIFANILHMWEPNLLVRRDVYGQMILTGINTNAGLLPPIILFFLLMTNNLIMKCMGVLVFFLCGNSSMMICGIMYLLFALIRTITKWKIKVPAYKIVIIMVISFVCMIIIFLNTNMVSRILGVYLKLIDRITFVMSEELFTRDWSTSVHVRYYISVIDILTNSNLLVNLFGYGLGCGGLPFVIYYGQYMGAVYIPESDPISMLYSIGIVGTCLFYFIMAKIAIKGYRVDIQYTILMIILFVTGIFYNVQSIWVILIEWLFLEAVKHKVTMKEMFQSGVVKQKEFTCNDSHLE